MGQKWPKNPQNYVYLRPNETTKRGVSVRARVRRGEMAKREYERKFYINFIPIPPSWGGRQLWRVNQKNRRRDLRSHQTLHRIAPCALPPLTSPLTFPDPMFGAELSAVHDGRESCTLFTGCQDLQLPTLLHKTTATSMHFLIFFIYHCCSECWGEDRKLGIGLLPAPASSKFCRKWELSHFGGNRKHKKQPWWILFDCIRKYLQLGKASETRITEFVR